MSRSERQQRQPIFLKFLSVLTSALLWVPSWACAGESTWHMEAIQRRSEGLELERQGNLDGAIAILQKAAYLDPTYATPHNDLGVVYEAQGRLDEAEAEYKTALALDPGYAKAHANLALLYERLGQKELAGQHWLQRYTLGAPDDPWTHTAEEHLIALGFLESDSLPGTQPSLSPMQRATQAQFGRFATIMRDFESTTDPDGSIWADHPSTSVTSSQAR